MSLLRVFLGTPGPLPIRMEFAPVRSFLNGWFLRVAKVADALGAGLTTPQLRRPFDNVLVQYTSDSVQLEPQDILIYLVPDRGHSVIRLNVPGFPVDAMGEGGTTFRASSGQTCSEVYVDQAISWGSRAIAALAFHEAMHNKTELGNTGGLNLHSKEGVVLGGYPVSTTSEPSYEDIKILATALLEKNVPQWTAGFDLYKGKFG